MSELVLITGGAGFIGCHTAVRLLTMGYRVRALDSLRPPVHQQARRPPWLPAAVELLVGDVTDPRAMTQALDGASFVFHLAAYQDYLPDFATFFRINTASTALLYELIVRDHLPVARVVVASSQAVYGEGTYRCDRHGQYSVETRSTADLDAGVWDIPCPKCGVAGRWLPAREGLVHPHNQYALSKYTQELVALSLGRRYSIPTVVLRYSITQGRWQSPHNAYSGICRTFVMRALAGEPALIFEDGRQLRDYVHVDDVAAANTLAMTDPRTDFEIFNVAGSEVVSVLDYARTVSMIEPIITRSYRHGDTRHIVSDGSKLRGLGWTNTKTIADAVRDYRSWLESVGFDPDVVNRAMVEMRRVGTVRPSLYVESS